MNKISLSQDVCWRPIGKQILLLPWLHETRSLPDAIRVMSEELLLIHLQRTITVPAADPNLTFSEVNDSWSVRRRTVSSCVSDYLLQLRYSLKEITDTWLEFVQLETWLSFRNQTYSPEEQAILKATAILLLDTYLWYTVRDKLLFIGVEYMDHVAANSSGATPRNKHGALFPAIVYSLLNHPYQVPPAVLFFQNQSRKQLTSRGGASRAGTSPSPSPATSPFTDACLLRSYLQSLVALSTESLHWVLLLMLTVPYPALVSSITLHWPVSNITSASPSLCQIGRRVRASNVYSPTTAMILAFKPIASNVQLDTYNFILSMILHTTLSQVDLQMLSDSLAASRRETQLRLLCPKVFHGKLTMLRNLKALCLFARNQSLMEAVQAFVSLPLATASPFSLKHWMRLPVSRLQRHSAFAPLSAQFWDTYTAPVTPTRAAPETPPAASPAEEPYTIKFDTTPVPTATGETASPPLSVSWGAQPPLRLASVGATVTLQAAAETASPAAETASPSLVVFEYRTPVLLDSRAASILYIVAATPSAQPSLHWAGILSPRFSGGDAAGYCFDFEHGGVYAVSRPELLFSDVSRAVSGPLPHIKTRRFPVSPGSAGAFYLSMSPHEISWGAQKSVKAKLEVPSVPGDSWTECHYFVILGMQQSAVNVVPEGTHAFDPRRPCLRLHQCVVPSGVALPRHLHSRFYNRDNLGRESLAALLRPGPLDLTSPAPETAPPPGGGRRRSTTTDPSARRHSALLETARTDNGVTSDAGVSKPWRKRGRPPKKARLPTETETRDAEPSALAVASLRHRRALLALLLRDNRRDAVSGGDAVSATRGDLCEDPLRCPLCALDNIDLARIPPTATRTTHTPPETRTPPQAPGVCVSGTRSLRLWESMPLRMDFGAPGRLNRFRYSAVNDRR